MNRSWMDRAACLNITNTQRDRYFYPGTSGRPATEEAYEYARQTWCNTCPVTADCLAFALATGDKFGLYGGRTPTQRRELANGDIKHGTLSGYRQHYECNGQPCDECRTTRQEYDQRKKAS